MAQFVITKPMKAPAVRDLGRLRYPLLGSPKLDGIRCLKINGKLVTASLKPQPNRSVNKILTPLLEDGMDGELMLADPSAPFNEISSAFMSRDGEPDFMFHVFDWVGPKNEGYRDRWNSLSGWWLFQDRIVRSYVRVVHAIQLDNHESAQSFVDQCLDRGYEGAMFRCPDAPYKCGRSTIREQGLLKYKPFKDAEAKIVGFEEQQKNINAAKRDELGRAKRSSHKSGKKPKGTLGAIIVTAHTGPKWGGETFRIGTGFDDDLRREIWQNRPKFKGRIVKYKYQAHGSKDKPRIPVFLGFRDERDL